MYHVCTSLAASFQVTLPHEFHKISLLGKEPHGSSATLSPYTQYGT